MGRAVTRHGWAGGRNYQRAEANRGNSYRDQLVLLRPELTNVR